jgi:hypothetical protein
MFSLASGYLCLSGPNKWNLTAFLAWGRKPTLFSKLGVIMINIIIVVVSMIIIVSIIVVISTE